MRFTIYLSFDAIIYLYAYADFYEKLLPLPLKNVQLGHKSCSHQTLYVDVFRSETQYIVSLFLWLF